MDTIIVFIIGIVVIILSYLGISLKKDKKKAKGDIEDELKKKPAIDIIESLDNSESVKSIINDGGNRFTNTVRKILQRFGRKGIDISDIPGSDDGNRDNESGSSQDGDDSADSSSGNSGIGDQTIEGGRRIDGIDNSNGGDRNNSNGDFGNGILKKVSMFDERLLPEIRKTGCVYLVCAGIVTDIVKIAFDTDSLNKLYLEAIDNRYIVKNYITGYDRMITFLLKNMGSKLKALHIGGATELFYLPLEKQRTDATILCFRTQFVELGGEHYMQGDRNGKLIYDPAGGTYNKYCESNGFLRFHIS